MVDNSPTLGGQPGPTGREPGLPRLHQLRYEEMQTWELYELMSPEMERQYWAEFLARIKHLHKIADSPEWVSERAELLQWSKKRIVEYLTGKVK
jgi:hypothetical protein